MSPLKQKGAARRKWKYTVVPAGWRTEYTGSESKFTWDRSQGEPTYVPTIVTKKFYEEFKKNKSHA